jgi:hypothetical protein
MPVPQGGDLSFVFTVRKNGEVRITHEGRLAATLRGEAAAEFLRKVTGCSDAGAQQLMARLTRNYKRGNERLARSHPRNRP